MHFSSNAGKKGVVILVSKLVIALLITVLLGGAAMFAVGQRLVPAVGMAGVRTQSTIQDAFQ